MSELGFLLIGAFLGWTWAYVKYKAENSLFKNMLIDYAKRKERDPR